MSVFIHGPFHTVFLAYSTTQQLFRSGALIYVRLFRLAVFPAAELTSSLSSSFVTGRKVVSRDSVEPLVQPSVAARLNHICTSCILYATACRGSNKTDREEDRTLCLAPRLTPNPSEFHAFVTDCCIFTRRRLVHVDAITRPRLSDPD